MRLEGIIPREIDEGPQAIRATIASTSSACEELALALRADTRRIWVIGNGTSYHSSMFAASLARQLRTADEPIALAVTAGEFNALRPALGAGDVVVGVSASGEFRDVVAVFDELRGRVPTVAIVQVAESSLTRLADHVVLAAGGPSLVPVMTKTFSSTATAGALAVAALVSDKAYREVVRGVSAAADHAAAAIEGTKHALDRIVDIVGGGRLLFVVGGGNAHPAALEGALKLKEMALVAAEASETWEMTSGPATLVGPGTVVLALAPAGPARAATLEVAEHCRSWGATVIRLRAGEDADGVNLAEETEEAYSVLSVVPSVALIGFGLARRRGHDPDHPSWTERYAIQGLNHIVGIRR
jgi:glutamine---fructose-6-phosphate transaminase (isomerizing)